MTPRRAATAAAALAFGLGAAAAVWAADPGPAPPRVRNLSYYYDGFDQSIVRPIARSTDPAILIRNLAHNHREAANVDEHDQVRLPSTWWQPRVGYRPVTVEQMLAGPGLGGPAPGKLNIVKLKTQGVSPGFQIKDSAGQKFAIKFDPPQYPELASGADVVASFLYWAAGFNVPENTIVQFRREDLEIAPNAMFEDASGRKTPITPPMVDGVLARCNRGPDGRFRAVASRWLPGKPLGEWEYRGRRHDDPEDVIPHELRREIRGMYLIHGWLNNTDCSARNTFDSWITDGGRSFVRHYLIDFSGALGAASIGPQTYRGGSEYLMDYGAAGRSIATLGLKQESWEHVVDPNLPSVGFIESRQFDPEHWKPFLPNPAFDDRTERDLRWGARIVTGFTDEQIRAAVAMGRYTDPRASEYLVRTLIERRDAIARRWPPVATTARHAP